jgi:predicted transcriptional regulator
MSGGCADRRVRHRELRPPVAVQAQTIRLPASFWQRVRVLAVANRTTSIGEIREALEHHFARKLPEARARLAAVKS